MSKIEPPTPVPVTDADRKFIALTQCRQPKKKKSDTAMEEAVQRLYRAVSAGAGTAQVSVLSVCGSDTSEIGVHTTACVELLVRLCDMPVLQHFMNVVQQQIWVEADPSFMLEVNWGFDWTCATVHDMVVDSPNWTSLVILIGEHEAARTASSWAVDLVAESWELCRTEARPYLCEDEQPEYGEPIEPGDDPREFYMAHLRVVMDDTLGLLDAIHADRRDLKKEEVLLKEIFETTQRFLDQVADLVDGDDEDAA